MPGTTTATPEGVATALAEARERTLALVSSLGEADLERVHSPLMSPLVWDLGHIAAFEDLWLAHRAGGLPLLRADLAQVYDAFETPRAHRGDLPMLRTEAARAYMDAVRRRVLALIERDGVGHGRWHEMVLRHEHQHNETMLQTLQIAGLDGVRTAPRRPPPAPPGPAPTGLEFVAVDGGECTLGAPEDGFAYDNERPRHAVAVAPFLIGRTPVTNASYRAFVAGGGYERREWWSPEGWAFRQQAGLRRPGGWTADLERERRLHRVEPLDPSRPVVHISWYEAEAFARAHGARLPTEAEWEKAASWDPAAGRARTYPWGEEPPEPGRHANVDQLGGGPAPAGAHAAGRAPCGALGMIGDVWEWTASAFLPYPGFVADPYREYSEAFFGPAHRVLRGGSWATRPRLATATFRNWDLPQRRQIFAGLRLAQ